MTSNDALGLADELLPCPFCGGEAGYYDCAPKNAAGVVCGTCGVDIEPGESDNRKEARQRWNTRFPRAVPAIGAGREAREVSEVMLEAGAKALADDVWHPPQPFKSLSSLDRNKFTRQALLVLKAALASSPVVGRAEWPPIETAPKDGEIDLWCLNVSDGNSVRFPGMFMNDEGKWEDWHGYVLEPKWRPTHWQPLPTPPLNPPAPPNGETGISAVGGA